MMKISIYFYILILGMVISSCSIQGAESSPDVTPPALPDNGKSTIIGRVISKDTGKPMENEIVRLAEVYRQGDRGVYVLDMAFSPGTRTDEKGYFIFENIPAMEYVIVIGDYDAAYDIIEAPGSSLPETISVKADHILDVGELKAKPEYHP